MKVVAFLQNQWFRDPAKIRAMLARHDEGFRRRLLAVALFQSHSGRRLRAAFGELCCHEIIWENASPKIGSHARVSFRACREHMQAVLDGEQPDVVLAFGTFAEAGLNMTSWNGPTIKGPHPAARRAGVTRDLQRVAAELRSIE